MGLRSSLTMTLRLASRELLKLAEVELNEVSDRKIEDINQIKNWLLRQPSIKSRTDDQWILTFLRGAKFSLERTKEKLTHYYQMRTVAPDFFTNRDPLLPELQELLKLGICVPLNKSLDPIAPRVILIRNSGVNGESVSVVNMVKITLMVLDILTNEDDNFVIAGHIVIQDFKGTGLHHATQLTPVLIKNMMACFQHSYPSRPKTFHFINTPTVFYKMFGMVKPFMLEKLQKRVKIYKCNYQNDLCESIPKYILPIEYGGEGRSIYNLTDEWKSKIESYRDWFLEDKQFLCTSGVNVKSNLISEDFGIQGSFRKLTID